MGYPYVASTDSFKQNQNQVRQVSVVGGKGAQRGFDRMWKGVSSFPLGGRGRVYDPRWDWGPGLMMPGEGARTVRE